MKTTLKTVCHCSVSFGCAKTGFSGFILCFENGWTFFLLFSLHNWFGKKKFFLFLSNRLLHWRCFSIKWKYVVLPCHRWTSTSVGFTWVCHFFFLLLFLLFLLFVISNMQLGTKFDGKESNFNSYKKWEEKKKNKIHLELKFDSPDEKKQKRKAFCNRNKN